MKLLLAAFVMQLHVFNASFNYSEHTNETADSLSYHTSPVKVQNLDFLTSDGIKLKATYYSPGKAGPAMLLLHECDMDRKSWESLATSLVNAGIHVLTFDYRGYGESPAKGNLYEHFAADVDSALAKLLAQADVDSSKIAAGGASCGVSNAMQLAIRNPEIKSLFLLTGPLPEEAVAYIQSHPGVPRFAIENGDEVVAARELDAVMKNSKNPATIVKVYKNGAHGVPIFSKHPEIIPTVTSWLVQVLK